MNGLSSILSLLRGAFDKFNYTGAQMLVSIYHNMYDSKNEIVFLA